MTDKTEVVSVPRELLQDLIDSAQLEVDERLRAYGEEYRPHVLAAQRKVVADASAILAAPAEDVRAVGDERSQKDYAIEHAEYMATAADYVGEHFNAYGLALFEFDESDADDDSDMLEAIDSAREDLQESMTNLRHMVYEFRKRRARAIQQ